MHAHTHTHTYIYECFFKHEMETVRIQNQCLGLRSASVTTCLALRSAFLLLNQTYAGNSSESMMCESRSNAQPSQVGCCLLHERQLPCQSHRGARVIPEHVTRAGSRCGGHSIKSTTVQDGRNQCFAGPAECELPLCTPKNIITKGMASVFGFITCASVTASCRASLVFV